MKTGQINAIAQYRSNQSEIQLNINLIKTDHERFGSRMPQAIFKRNEYLLGRNDEMLRENRAIMQENELSDEDFERYSHVVLPTGW